ASPAGEAWEEELFWTDRLASIALASIGQRPMPENVTEDELAAVGEILDRVIPDEEAEYAKVARRVLPEPMQAMGPSQLATVGRAITERLHSGWTEGQITAVLNSRELPPHVRNLVAVVLARLRDDVPPNQPPPQADNDSPAGWSHVLPEGRVITRRDLDTGALAQDFHRAVKEGTWQSGDRWAFAVAVGVERYLISR
uniref:hypothetical protein n=1 Tax=Corynebacterium senegalense TaxID=2080750 RepID=UPI001C6A622E